MYKLLKIGVPIGQALLAVIGYDLARLFPSSQWIYPTASFIKDLVGKLNFPLETLWMVIFLGVDRMNNQHLQPNGPLFVIVLIIVGILLISSVAAFWYFIVSEIEMRSQGKSILRSSRPLKQAFISAVLLGLGSWALFIAYSGHSFSSSIRNVNLYILLRGLILLAWAVVLVGVAIHDLIVCFRIAKLPSRLPSVPQKFEPEPPRTLILTYKMARVARACALSRGRTEHCCSPEVLDEAGLESISLRRDGILLDGVAG